MIPTFTFISGHSLARIQGTEEIPSPDVNIEMRRKMISNQSERREGRRSV